MSKLTLCKVCEKEVSKGASVCPHCGEKLKSGWLGKIFKYSLVAILVVFIVAITASPSEEEIAHELSLVESSKVDNIKPIGTLYDMFSYGSTYTDIQRENMEKELIGKIIQWTLPVYEVNKEESVYTIDTSDSILSFSNKNSIETRIKLYPKNEQEMLYIEKLKTGNKITIKGKITGVSMRVLEIDYARLINN